MNPKTYTDVCRLECPNGCGRGLPRVVVRVNGPIRWEHVDGSHWTPCTAPNSPDALIERLLAEAVSMREELARLKGERK